MRRLRPFVATTATAATCLLLGVPVAQADGPAAPAAAPVAPRSGAATLAAAPAAAPSASRAPRTTEGDADEPKITAPGAEGDYLRALHRSIHWRWYTKFLEVVEQTRPANDPLNNKNLEVEVLFTIRWDGSAAEVTVAQKSGLPAFDAAAVAAVRGEVPYPVPPLELFGDDGVAHFQWVLARDRRLCSGGEVRRREAPLEEALPRLLYQSRNKEALLRVARHTRAGDATAMSAFARAWLARPFVDAAADARAAAALVRAGDRRQIDRLTKALYRVDTVSIAAPALASVKVDICPLVLPMLQDRAPGMVALGMQALREAGGDAPSAACVQAVAAIVGDTTRLVSLRAQALEQFAAYDYGSARKLALAAMEAPEPAMRAAGARAFARPDGGRASLYRLEPGLRDPSVEVRAATAAGLVRACGDLAKDHLQAMFKERGSQGLMAMAPELGKQSTPGSAEMLGRMLKRPDPQLQMAVLSALAGRRDAPARAIFQPLADAVKKDPRASYEARVIAFSTAEPDELLPLARDQQMGVLAFKALLRARRHQEASDWLVASFDRLSPAQQAEAFGAWLANPPAAVAAAK